MRNRMIRVSLIAVLLGGWGFPEWRAAPDLPAGNRSAALAQANPLLIRNSFLINAFGPGILNLFNN